MCRESEVVGDETIAREAVRFPGCEAVTAEQHYCLTTSDGEIALLGLESGSVCPLTPTTAPFELFEGSSIAWLGEVVYACTPEGLVRISLRDGRWEAAQLPCQAVTAYGGRLLVMLSLEDPLFWSVFPDASFSYPDYAALLGGRFDASYDLGLGSTRMTVQGDTFYGAWHSTDTLNLVDLSSGRGLGPLQLESYDDWVLGMSVTADGLLAISGPDWGQTVVLFDAHTGTRLRELRLARPAIGLACVTRR